MSSLALKTFLKSNKPLVVKMDDDLHAITTTKTILSSYVMLKLSWASLAFYPCWR
jgi:hypothetical protein